MGLDGLVATRSAADRPDHGDQQFVADAWCAAFLWPKQPGAIAEAAPTNEVWQRLRDGQSEPNALTVKTVDELSRRYRFFHWHLAFPEVFARGGFDVVLGNPPWIAHAGRAAQPLPPAMRRFFEHLHESFADYPTTHGMFASAMARSLRMGGTLGVVVPSSLSELDGYTPTRRAHNRLCEFPGELIDFGEGQFPGVTQPCMALVSRRAPGGRSDAPHGHPWPVARPDLTPGDRRLLARLAALDTLPDELFGERGIQSDKSLAPHIIASSVPIDRFVTPVRTGTDVREFELRPPLHHVDPKGFGSRMRTPESSCGPSPRSADRSISNRSNIGWRRLSQLPVGWFRASGMAPRGPRGSSQLGARPVGPLHAFPRCTPTNHAPSKDWAFAFDSRAGQGLRHSTEDPCRSRPTVVRSRPSDGMGRCALGARWARRRVLRTDARRTRDRDTLARPDGPACAWRRGWTARAQGTRQGRLKTRTESPVPGRLPIVGASDPGRVKPVATMDLEYDRGGSGPKGPSTVHIDDIVIQ